MYKELLPVHLKPKEDELLSSWLIRLSIGHGLKPSIFGLRVFPGPNVGDNEQTSIEQIVLRYS